MMPLDANLLVAIQPPYLGCAQHRQCRGSWAVAQTHPQAERWAQSNLQRLGYVTFLPLYASRVRDRVVQTLTRIVERPLFSRYLFVQHDNPDLWRPIREAPGVASVLTNGNRIQYVNAGAVEALQATEDARRSPMPRNAQYRPGVACTPRDGPFQGLPGVVLSTQDDIATVGILFLGALREIPMPFDSLIPRDCA